MVWNKSIRDFFHSARNRIRGSEDLVVTPFTTGDRYDIIERYNAHRQYMIDVEGMAKNDRPKTFTDKLKWIDWKVT